MSPPLHLRLMTANDLAFADFFCSCANRRVGMARIDRNASNELHKPMQHRFVIEFLVDDVTNRARTGELEDEGVHPADMIRHEKKPAGRQVFQAQRSDAIKEANQWLANEVERAFGSGLAWHRL